MDFVIEMHHISDKMSTLRCKEWKRCQSKTFIILLSFVKIALHINLINCSIPKEILGNVNILYGHTNEDMKESS